MPKIQLESQLVRAGAGTGKTTCLVNEVYSLFKKFRELEGRNPKLIVCTFTRKASQELKERLFKKAIEELSEREQQSLKQNGLEEEKQNFQKEKNNKLESQSLFLNYIQSPSLYISTIDGILNLFLKRYGHRFDLSPDFQLNYGQANEALFDSLAEEFIFEKNFSLLKKIPYPLLKELFLFYFKCRLKYGEISFYNTKDFAEFNQQRDLFLTAGDLFKKTKNKKLDIIKIKQYLKENKSPLEKLLNKHKDIEDIKQLFEEEESFKADDFVPLFEEFDQAGKEFFLSFLEKKKKTALLDIEDLLLFSLALLRENPKTAQSFSKEWNYWLIDEYQDTSWIQEQIIDKITGFKNVFCVGDPAQSIYLFRDADSRVFKRRENALTSQVQKLNINYRSSASLIYFYNDFFPENKSFMKFKPPEDKQVHCDKPCVYFLTYEKDKEQKEKYKQRALTALYHYIQKLVSEGFNYSDIAVLSSNNDDLIEIASYLRSQNLPLMLYSSKSFSQKRLILDALFLLKFLINPYDNINLKALLRTPYFRLSDQDLADSSYEHFEFCKNKEPCSFWSFIKEKFSDRVFIKSLISYLADKQEKGFIKSFERALMDSGFMDLSYFQDPTGSSESNLWKFLSLLNKDSSSALELFYSLISEEDGEDSNKEAPSCENSESIELMTIHKSKGLEFKHIVVMDFSIGSSAFKSGNKTKDLIIYDETKQKMAFSVPIGGRYKKKIKSYAHKVYNKKQGREMLLEKERLFYVAMTRAKQSLALFIPNSVPEKNSWLYGVGFFKNFIPELNQILLEEQYDKQDKKKLKSWRLNEGFYKTNQYLFCVKSSESMCQSPNPFIDTHSELKSLSPAKKTNQKKEKLVSIVEDKYFGASSESIYKSEEDFIDSAKDFHTVSLSKKEDQKKKIPVLTGGKEYFGADFELQVKSSKHFVKDTIEKDKFSNEKIFNFKRAEIPNKKSTIHSKETFFQKEEIKSPFYFSKAKNILFKTNLGNHLHSFLQRLSYRSFEQVKTLIENSFLSQEDKEQIQQALIYIIELKNPHISCFLKTGFPEWPFQLKTKKVLLQGQIDLWSWDDKQIRLFDYKSSKSQSPQTEKQLIFYSWILDEFYHPEKIWMYEVYPFQKIIHESLYNKSHKRLFEDWLAGMN